MTHHLPSQCPSRAAAIPRAAAVWIPERTAIASRLSLNVISLEQEAIAPPNPTTLTISHMAFLIFIAPLRISQEANRRLTPQKRQSSLRSLLDS